MDWFLSLTLFCVDRGLDRAHRYWTDLIIRKRCGASPVPGRHSLIGQAAASPESIEPPRDRRAPRPSHEPRPARSGRKTFGS